MKNWVEVLIHIDGREECPVRAQLPDNVPLRTMELARVVDPHIVTLVLRCARLVCERAERERA